MSEPLTIRGFATVFGVVGAPGEGGSRLRIEPGAFRLAGAIIPLCFGHDPTRAYASTFDRSLRLCQTDVGLQFEADVDDYSLIGGIVRGVYNAVSVLYPADRQSRVETIAGERVEVIERTRIGEVSIVPEGACPGACAWLADQAIDEMRPEVRTAALLWCGATHALPSARLALAPRNRSSGLDAAPLPRAGRADPFVNARIDRALAAAATLRRRTAGLLRG